MELTTERNTSLMNGRFIGKRTLDRETRPGEVARVVARAKQGDEAAMRFLYLRFADNVYGYARGILRDEYEAEDVTQQVFTRLITALRTYEQRDVPFTAWLLRITHNMAIDHMRRRMPLCDATDLVAGRGGTTDSHDDLSLALREALGELPEAQREVVMLRHLGGYSPGEIGEMRGCSEDSIHGLHHRGRRALQASLRRMEVVPATV